MKTRPLSDYGLYYIPKIPEKNQEKINFRMFLKIMKLILIILEKNWKLEVIIFSKVGEFWVLKNTQTLHNVKVHQQIDRSADKTSETDTPLK